MSSVEQGIWREILTQINAATVEGLMLSSAPSHSEAFLSALRHSNEVFAAFKVHALQQEVAAKLLTPDGRLKSFAEFRRDVEGITSHQCGAWLQTEYDTAVIRAHNAADWQGFEANKDIMPNLRWLPTTAPDPEVHHRSYWVARLNLPVDDPFWQHHHPGDHWNCKCSLEQNNDPVVRPSGITTKPNEPTKPNRPNMPIEPKVADPQPGLDNNPGKDGHTFSDNHPYFPKSCKQCGFYKPSLKNRLKAAFANRQKDCYNYPYIDGCLHRNEEKRPIDEKAFRIKQDVIEHDLMPKMDKTSCKALVSGLLNRTNKVRNTLLKHCRHDYDVKAAIYIWNNPSKMKYVRESPLGEDKDMSLPKNIANIKKKREKLHFVTFQQYEFKHEGKVFEVKMAHCKKGHEQFYSLKEK